MAQGVFNGSSTVSAQAITIARRSVTDLRWRA